MKIAGFFPYKRSLQRRTPSSFTRHGWVRLASIAQYSSLLPPVRSRARVSVPVWLIMLSHQLLIVGLVGRYPTNYLIRRTLISFRNKALISKRCLLNILWGINPVFTGLSPRMRQIAYVFLTRLPVAANVLLHRAAPRLACVRPAASVHPEPGSNSPL